LSRQAASIKLRYPFGPNGKAGETLMKPMTMLLIAAAFAMAAGSARAASTDDVKWINQCVKDNKGDAADDVVLKYCTCMNNKMSENETQSITQWEKTHATERKACDKEAGWK
jgi:hypothetical protein